MNSTEPHAAYRGTYDGCDACDASNPYAAMTQAIVSGMSDKEAIINSKADMQDAA
jgi:hypothetical protein